MGLQLEELQQQLAEDQLYEWIYQEICVSYRQMLFEMPCVRLIIKAAEIYKYNSLIQLFTQSKTNKAYNGCQKLIKMK